LRCSCAMESHIWLTRQRSSPPTWPAEESYVFQTRINCLAVPYLHVRTVAWFIRILADGTPSARRLVLATALLEHPVVPHTTAPIRLYVLQAPSRELFSIRGRSLSEALISVLQQSTSSKPSRSSSTST